MKRTGPDSLEGLFILLICCLISTLMYGSSGLSSLLFVACLARYNADRNDASFPFILSNVLQAVSGPFAGYFANRFSVRSVVLAGSILSFLGIGACFFAEDITTVTILWGIVFGTGYGLSTLLLPAVINDYFLKYRSLALGLCYLGSPIGFFIFPPIFEVLLDKYDLSGTFLFLAAMNMHCIPLSIFLKQPKFKIEDENSPLNSGEPKGSYLSTNTTKPSRTEVGKNSDLKGQVNPCFRRSSVEFLWKQPPTPESSTPDKNQQYVLSLNKKNSDAFYPNSEISRSYKRTNRNHYGNLDCKGPFTDITHFSNGKSTLNGLQSNSDPYSQRNLLLNGTKVNNEFSCGGRELAGEKSKPETTGSSASHFLHVSLDSKVLRDSDCRQFHIPDNQEYEEFSTIYFGTDQKSHSHGISGVDLERQSNHNAASDTNKLKGNAHTHCHDLLAQPYDTNTDEMPEVPRLIKYRKIGDYPEDNGHRDESNVRTSEISNADKPKNNSLLDMYLNPVFILICIVNGIGSLHFSTLVTVIIDFSRDIQIDIGNEKFIMMCISLMGGFGMLGFGWVTDGGYMTRTRFASLSQLIGCVATSLLPLTVGFETLMIALAIWCVCQSSFIPLIPAIIAEYFNEDIQAVAVSACNVLSGPLYLITPPLIGYFRDEKGSYDNIFYLLGILSFVNSIALLTIPCLARWRKKS